MVAKSARFREGTSTKRSVQLRGQSVTQKLWQQRTRGCSTGAPGLCPAAAHQPNWRVTKMRLIQFSCLPVARPDVDGTVSSALGSQPERGS